jgi:Ca2+-binding EF-hand superfamily protein
MTLVFTSVWATARSGRWGSGWDHGEDSSLPSDTVVTSDTTNENDISKKMMHAINYGSLPNHDEPSLTQNYKEEEGVWSLLRSWIPYLFIYFFMAVVAYSYVFEHWTIVDSIYFAVATFTTIGYSDLQPSTIGGQAFTIVFAIYGIIILGVFIGIFGHSVSEARSRAVTKLKKRDQSRLLRLLFHEHHSTKHIMKKDTQLLQDNFINDHHSLVTVCKQVLWEEFPQIGLVTLFAAILGYREGWSLISTVYFTIMSASTTGFGNYVPTTQTDKIYCIFFFPVSVAVFGEVLGKIAGIYIQQKYRRKEQMFLKRAITLCDLNRMDADDDGEVHLSDFLSFMLVALQKVDQESIDELKELFKNLDSNGNGVLDKDDVVAITESSPLYDIQVHLAERHAATVDSEEASNENTSFRLQPMHDV